MHIYFLASRTQLPNIGKNYPKIIQCLKKLGHTVDESYIHGIANPTASKEELNQEFKAFVKAISAADAVVAELTFPSTLNIGYRVSLALARNKPVIGLYAKGGHTPFFETIDSDKFIYDEYTPETLEKTIQQTLEFIDNHNDTRFNFILPPSLIEYLDWIAKNEKVPRSVYLRKLIEKDRSKNHGYQD